MGRTPIPNPHRRKPSADELRRRIERLERRAYGTPISNGGAAFLLVCVLVVVVAILWGAR